MTDDRHESPILFHLNSEIYKNGLKFERDRTFRNRLIVKTIILMAVLLLIATISCVLMARSSNVKTKKNESYIHLDRKESIYHEPEIVKSFRGHEDIQTTWAPSPNDFRIISLNAAGANHFSVRKTDKARRRRTINSINGFHSEISDGSSKFPGTTTVTPVIFRLSPPKNKNGDEKTNGGNIDRNTSIKAEGENRMEKVREMSEFWMGGRDLQSVRNSQAKRMLSYMDLTADPCDDFYQYACGNWHKNNPIPQDKAGYDIFELLRESLDIVLRDLLMEPSDNNTYEAVVKARVYYESCMNEEILEKRGNDPLLELIRKLKGWPTLDEGWNSTDFDWIELMSQIKLYNIDVLVSQWVGPDIKNSSHYIIQFDQTSLGLPSKDYFLNQAYANYLEAYKKYLIKITVLLGAGLNKATTDAEELLQFEKELAKITLGQEERRNMTQLYVKLTLSELHELIPQVDWVKYLSIVMARNVERNESVVTYAMKYFEALGSLLEKTDKRIISNYLIWRLARHLVNGLDRKFQDAKQELFYSLFGREKAPLRWSYCVSQVNSNLGMALGNIFVQRYFDKSSKKDAINITQHIMYSFSEMLNSTDWLDQETRALALEKINAMVPRIGYPDFVLNKEELENRYRNVSISKTTYFENTLNILQHMTRYEQAKLGKVVNSSLWNTPPTTVNAYYSRNINQIMVPAGILQPPFYHKYFPKCLNYGGIGVAIGHEITHGFDDKGRLFDQKGNYRTWWKEETAINFQRRAQCLIDQYSGYRVRDVDMHIDGVNTQAENIADNGGIRQAFRAYEGWLNQKNSADEVMPGINATNFQLFFLNFAQIWCGGMRPEASRNKLKIAHHSPGRFRVIGTLSNSEEFARVFNCPSNTTMNPGNKCSLW